LRLLRTQTNRARKSRKADAALPGFSFLLNAGSLSRMARSRAQSARCRSRGCCHLRTDRDEVVGWARYSVRSPPPSGCLLPDCSALCCSRFYSFRLLRLIVESIPIRIRFMRVRGCGIEAGALFSLPPDAASPAVPILVTREATGIFAASGASVRRLPERPCNRRRRCSRQYKASAIHDGQPGRRAKSRKHHPRSAPHDSDRYIRA